MAKLGRISGGRHYAVATIALILTLIAGACAESAWSPSSQAESENRLATSISPGGATAPVSMRIYLSDVVVWARLVGSTEGGLLFQAIEYLKGSGKSEFVVNINPWERRTGPWDDRDAILFLSLPEGQATSHSGARSEYTFTDTVPPDYEFYSPSLPTGVRFDTRNPVWLPAVTPALAADTQDPDPHFFIEEVSPAGIELPTISLSELRSMVEWQKNPGGVAGYNACVEASAWHEQGVRDEERTWGVSFEILDARSRSLAEEVPSGAPEGTIIVDYVIDDEGYTKVWIEEGPHAYLFRAFIFDDDENPANGYAPVEATTRPLPTGVYTFKTRNQPYRYQPCNFDPIGNGAYVQVPVIAPPGTWHEAFFDPVMLPDGSVGANTIQGVLEPYRLLAGLSGAEIVSLAWSNGTLTLIGDDILSLEAYTLDFFALDGSLSLSLDVDSAEWVNEVDSRYTWYVPDQPWRPGDKLMLRIRQTDVGPTIVSQQRDLTAQLHDYQTRRELAYAEYALASDLENTQQGIAMDDQDDALSQENSSGPWYALAIILLLSVGVSGAMLSRR